MLPASTAPSSSSRGLSFVQSSAGCTCASQSTMLPRKEKSNASNAPITAVSSVVASRYLRSPVEHAHRNAKKPRGGVTGTASGEGATRGSKIANKGLVVAWGCDSGGKGESIRVAGSGGQRSLSDSQHVTGRRLTRLMPPAHHGSYPLPSAQTSERAPFESPCR